uniref:Uncharacterized protein n=1 Tax=Boodleopsis pusilla TaxID=381415 RepID=A0A386AZH8_9CHLO|nr:hypothetical protein [Boodleopsis pusilla]AYC64849.1 hypothetical protein [Boodleopsis pusilla]
MKNFILKAKFVKIGSTPQIPLNNLVICQKPKFFNTNPLIKKVDVDVNRIESINQSPYFLAEDRFFVWNSNDFVEKNISEFFEKYALIQKFETLESKAYLWSETLQKWHKKLNLEIVDIENRLNSDAFILKRCLTDQETFSLSPTGPAKGFVDEH